MEYITKLEKRVLSWFKTVPGLPVNGRKWLADNVWWIALVGAILTGMSILQSIGSIMTLLAVLNTVVGSYYVTTAGTTLSIVSSLIGIFFMVVSGVLLAVAVKPLKAKLKKGWVLLFAAWLVSALGVFASAVLSFSIVGFVITILFGAVWIVISGYFLFEIHGQFAHVERSAGVKKARLSTK